MDDHSDDNWIANADMEVLLLRATLYEKIRKFFKQREVLEVDTPVLSVATTPDPNIHSFETQYISLGDEEIARDYYLSTSPEFHMKRLLASGSGSIYQLCHVFRQTEYGKQHNPEFTMLEWYRVQMDYQALMREVAELVSFLMDRTISVETITYQDAFLRFLEIDPLNATCEELRQSAERLGLIVDDLGVDDRDLFLDFLMSHQIQPQLGKDELCFVYEYPATQCAYAQISASNALVAQRFELFYQGVELANGYQELIDATEQQSRFVQQNTKRELAGQMPVNLDDNFLTALKKGMPECSGVALGVDRLIQAMLDAKNIADVLAFSFNRA